MGEKAIRISDSWSWNGKGVEEINTAIFNADFAESWCWHDIQTVNYGDTDYSELDSW